MAGTAYSADILLKLLAIAAAGTPYNNDAMLRHLFENKGRPLLDAYGEPVRSKDDSVNLDRNTERDYMCLIVNEDPFKYVKRTKTQYLPHTKTPRLSYDDVLAEQDAWFNENAYATAFQTVLGSFADQRNRASRLGKIAATLAERGIERDDINEAIRRCKNADEKTAGLTTLALGRLLFAHAERKPSEELEPQAKGAPAASDTGNADANAPAGASATPSSANATPSDAPTLRTLLALLADGPSSPLGVRAWSEEEALNVLLPAALIKALPADGGGLERALSGALTPIERQAARDVLTASNGFALARWREQLATLPGANPDATWTMLADLKSSTNSELKRDIFAISRASTDNAPLALVLLLALALLGMASFEGLPKIAQANL